MHSRNLVVTNKNSIKGKSLSLSSIILSTIIVFLLFFPLTFMHLIFHEGGHALGNLFQGKEVEFIYAHPFSFVGFSRPMTDYQSIWTHISGTLVEIGISVIIFAFLWKRRSFYTLPFLMIFPWVCLYNGLGGILDILGKSGDSYNLLRITGMSAAIPITVYILLAIVGIFLFISLFPLLGIAPKDKRSLLVLPVGMLLYCVPGIIVAHLLVPGSPIDVRYHLANEIIVSADYRPFFIVAIALLLAMVYVILYRMLYLKLPSNLRTEKINLTWMSMLYPGILFVISIVAGFIIIL